MTSIKSILKLFTYLRNAEHFNINHSIVRFLRGKLESIPVLQKLFLLYEVCFEEEDIAFKRLAALLETSSLRTLDRSRDDLTISLRRTVEAARYNHDAAIKEAGENLDLVLRNYRNANSKPYTENTALVYNMLQDFHTAENLPFVRLLGLEETLAELKKFNDDFSLLYDERAMKKEENRQGGPLKMIRGRVDDALQGLINGINTLFAANELESNDESRDGLLREIIAAMNSFIYQAEDVYYRRVERKKPERKVEISSPELLLREPYFMDVAEQDELSSGNYYFTDADPEAFTGYFTGISLDGAEFYSNLPEPDEKPDFFFNGYLEENGLLKGFMIQTSRLTLGLSSVTVNDAVMIKNGAVILRFSPIRIPVFLD